MKRYIKFLQDHCELSNTFTLYNIWLHFIEFFLYAPLLRHYTSHLISSYYTLYERRAAFSLVPLFGSSIKDWMTPFVLTLTASSHLTTSCILCILYDLMYLIFKYLIITPIMELYNLRKSCSHLFRLLFIFLLLYIFIS